MIHDTDGTPFRDFLENGQTWIKGNREKTLIHFDERNVWYKTKDDVKNGKMTRVKRNSFRAWITSGARLKGEEVDKIEDKLWFDAGDTQEHTN